VRKTTFEAQLGNLSAQLDNKTMGALNGAVDLKGQTVEDVALEFLRSRGLLSKP
jgi:glycine betaine/choline ABC-type transport system substrate-binding protein